MPPGLVTRSRKHGRRLARLQDHLGGAGCGSRGQLGRQLGGNPAAMPPAASASIILYTNAGPDPERPVTASSMFSGTSNAAPTAESKSATKFAIGFGGVLAQAVAARALADEARRVGHHADNSLPGRQRRRQAASSVTPAAIETTSASERIASRSAASASPICLRLHRQKDDIGLGRLAAAIVGFDRSRRAPRSRTPAALRGSDRWRRSRQRAPFPACTSPRASAVAMRPAPIKPIRIASIDSTRKVI